ncbi:MAG: hypothetical protein ACRCT8_09795 [Lacipirellulaceae bacterium]
MAEGKENPNELRAAVEAIRRGRFTERDAERLFDCGRESVKFVLLALAAAAV